MATPATTSGSAGATPVATLGSAGVIGAASQFASALVAGHFQRQAGKLQARQIEFQNGANQRSMAIQNSANQSEWIVARSQASLARAQAAADNKMREAGNIAGAAAAGLDNWARSVSNERMLQQGGEVYQTAVTNQLRNREAVTDGSIESRLAAAESRGAYAAATAMAGVSGGSVDGIATSMELQNQRRQFYQERAQGYADYDTMKEIIGIQSQSFDKLDLRVTQANRDLGFSVGPSDPLAPVGGISFNQQVPQTWGSAATDGLAWFMNNDNNAASRQLVGAVSSWFTNDTPDPYPNDE